MVGQPPDTVLIVDDDAAKRHSITKILRRAGFAIKEDPATATIPVLHVSTTFVDIEDRVQGLEGGADGYLTDVLEPLELIATVRALLRARRAEEAAQISSRQWQGAVYALSDRV